MIAVAGLLDSMQFGLFLGKLIGPEERAKLVDELQAKKIAVHVTNTAIKFVLDGEALGVSPVPIDTLKAIINGEPVLPTVLAALKQNFKKAASNALKDHTAKPLIFSHGKVEPVAAGGWTPTPYTGAGLPEFETNSKGRVLECSQSQMQNGPVVKLRDATRMYQPVHGTTEGSRYFLIAGNSDVRIAARWKNAQLSFRVEGAIAQVKENLMSAGLTGTSDDYLSLHLKIGDDLTARKAIGAVLFGTGLVFRTHNPDFKALKHGT